MMEKVVTLVCKTLSGRARNRKRDSCAVFVMLMLIVTFFLTGKAFLFSFSDEFSLSSDTITYRKKTKLESKREFGEKYEKTLTNTLGLRRCCTGQPHRRLTKRKGSITTSASSWLRVLAPSSTYISSFPSSFTAHISWTLSVSSAGWFGKSTAGTALNS